MGKRQPTHEIKKWYLKTPRMLVGAHELFQFGDALWSFLRTVRYGIPAKKVLLAELS